MAYVSTPGLHEEFAQPEAAEPAALGFQEELAQLNEAEPAALQGGSQEPTVEGTMSLPPDFAAQLHAAFLRGVAAGYPSPLGTPGLPQFFTPQAQGWKVYPGFPIGLPWVPVFSPVFVRFP